MNTSSFDFGKRHRIAELHNKQNITIFGAHSSNRADIFVNAGPEVDSLKAECGPAARGPIINILGRISNILGTH